MSSHKLIQVAATCDSQMSDTGAVYSPCFGGLKCDLHNDDRCSDSAFGWESW